MRSALMVHMYHTKENSHLYLCSLPGECNGQMFEQGKWYFTDETENFYPQGYDSSIDAYYGMLAYAAHAL